MDVEMNDGAGEDSPIVLVGGPCGSRVSQGDQHCFVLRSIFILHRI